MKHLRSGAVVGAGVLAGGIIWNLLGDNAGITIALAAAATIVTALIDWLTERRGT